MNQDEFEVLLEWFMITEPWPLAFEKREIIEVLLNDRAIKQGFTHWREAHHKLLAIRER